MSSDELDEFDPISAYGGKDEANLQYLKTESASLVSPSTVFPGAGSRNVDGFEIPVVCAFAKELKSVSRFFVVKGFDKENRQVCVSCGFLLTSTVMHVNSHCIDETITYFKFSNHKGDLASDELCIAIIRNPVCPEYVDSALLIAVNNAFVESTGEDPAVLDNIQCGCQRMLRENKLLQFGKNFRKCSSHENHHPDLLLVENQKL